MLIVVALFTIIPRTFKNSYKKKKKDMCNYSNVCMLEAAWENRLYVP